MGTTVFNLPDGSTFNATERHVPEISPFGSFGDGSEAADRIKAWVSSKWNILFQLKRGEQERLTTCEMYWAGFHYWDAWDNRENAVTNYCFSTVETIWPILTQARPRPEPVPRNPMDVDKVKKLADYAQFKMDTSGYDKVFRMAARDLLKYGWCCPMINWDDKGRAIPKYLSPFDFYPDAADQESDMEVFAIAMPVPTRRLRALFPAVADQIQPDNIASPRYRSMVRPYLEQAGVLGGLSSPPLIGALPITAPVAVVEDGPAATTSAEWGIDTGNFQVFGQTTFLIQMFCRDYTTMSVRYVGNRQFSDPNVGQYSIPYSMMQDEPCCPSGWRMIPMTASGTLLAPPMPVDPCLGGIPLVIGRDYEAGGRFFAKGELDDVIPIQRAINRTDQLIDRALELQANPPVLVSKDARLNVDKNSVEGGEIITHSRGSTISYLQPSSVAESHFERRAMRRQDIQIVAGTPDSLQGQRPVGVEAAAAIRQLTESAASRARAKGSGMIEWAALLLQKMIHCDIRKSTDVIYFKSSDGTTAWLDPQDFDPDDFEIRWASQSGDAQGEQDRIDQDMQLLQLGVIDGQQVLDDLDYPGRRQIMQRMAIRQAQQAQAQAAAAAAQTPSNGNGNGGRH